MLTASTDDVVDITSLGLSVLHFLNLGSTLLFRNECTELLEWRAEATEAASSVLCRWWHSSFRTGDYAPSRFVVAELERMVRNESA